jgi:GrpB-like predicted nucleotidyltransferase (UPF0157 family)
MKIPRMPDTYYDRYSEAPVEIKPFDPLSKQRALVYGVRLNQTLAQQRVSAELFGSTDLEIATKGEWEFGIWLDDTNWFPILTALINHYRSIGYLADDFARFNDVCEGTEVEIIAMRGERAVWNQAFMGYMRAHPAARQAYEQGKMAHAYSKRAYMRWKDTFIADVLESL